MKVLDSFKALEQHLVADTLKAVVMVEMAMGVAAKIVQEGAKHKIGEYQQAAGPFSAWEPLAVSTEDEKARLGFPTDAPLLRTGDMRDSIVTEHNALEAIIGSKDPVAKYQEMGTEKIPARSFLGAAAYESKDKIRAVVGVAAAGSFGGTPTISALYETKNLNNP